MSGRFGLGTPWPELKQAALGRIFRLRRRMSRDEVRSRIDRQWWFNMTTQPSSSTVAIR
jgi:hypothetical protein